MVTPQTCELHGIGIGTRNKKLCEESISNLALWLWKISFKMCIFVYNIYIYLYNHNIIYSWFKYVDHLNWWIFFVYQKTIESSFLSIVAFSAKQPNGFSGNVGDPLFEALQPQAWRTHAWCRAVRSTLIQWSLKRIQPPSRRLPDISVGWFWDGDVCLTSTCFFVKKQF